MLEKQPDPKWVEWAEAECVRRLTVALAEIQARKQGHQTEELERSFSAWAPEAPEADLEVRLDPPPPPRRVIRIHAENLQDA